MVLLLQISLGFLVLKSLANKFHDDAIIRTTLKIIERMTVIINLPANVD